MKMVPISIATLLALSATLLGCSTTDTESGTQREDITITNCGHDIHLTETPQRVVTLEQNATEMLLALGVGDRMVGQAYQIAPPLSEFAAAYQKVPVLADQTISAEQLREAQPDFTFSTLGSFYQTSGVGTVDELSDLGVASYVSGTDCPDGESQPASFEQLFSEYRDLGKIFGKEAAAQALIAKQQQILDLAPHHSGTPMTVAWFYSTYNGAPIVAGAGGMPAAISSQVGLRNVFDDVTSSTWPEVSWEQVAQRDPDIIVIADLSNRGRPGDSAADKRELLRSDAVASQLSAVANDRIVEISGTEMDPSIRSINAVDTLNKWLAESGHNK